jgi:proteic killer suppression protein
MIVSFGNRDTHILARGRKVARFVAIESVARRKLRQLQIAESLEDLRWTPAGAEDVEIVDYH